MIDIGINLVNKRFSLDRDKVVKRAIEVGVTKMVVTGVSVENSQKAVELVRQYKGILYSTSGIHPHDSKSSNPQQLAIIRKLALEKEVVAVGECGLDFNRNYSPPADQEKCFKGHLEIATEIQKPLFLHERDAHKRFIEIVSDYPNLPKGVVHCFTGNTIALKAYLNRGFYIGITGAVCNPKMSYLQEFVKYIPLDRLMVETDGPFMLPKNMEQFPKNRRNEPAFLPYVVKMIAECMGKSEAEIAEATTKTAEGFFGI